MRKQVAILLGDLVKSSEITAESERTILLFDKKDRSCMSGGRGSNETIRKVLIEEFSENFQFNQRERVQSS